MSELLISASSSASRSFLGTNRLDARSTLTGEAANTRQP